MPAPPPLPSVSVVMPVVNEERHLRAAVDRILTQDYAGELDVTLAVGPSKDDTATVAAELASASDRIRVVDNPTGATPAGLNTAIAASAGEIVVRVDGHAMIPSDYVSTAVEVLQRTEADNVGGIMAAEGQRRLRAFGRRCDDLEVRSGRCLLSMSAARRGRPLPVYLGCFRRSALQRVGGYDESMERAQDWELNLRIRESGGVVYFTPDLKVTYRPRHSMKALARQYHDYGRWRREVARRHPSTLSVRYLAAPVTVATIAAGLGAAAVGVMRGRGSVVLAGLAPLAVYAAGNVAASVWTGARIADPPAALRLPAVFATMHGAWGVGFWRGGAGGGTRR